MRWTDTTMTIFALATLSSAALYFCMRLSGASRTHTHDVWVLTMCLVAASLIPAIFKKKFEH